jgi:hypothetical protein
MSRGRTVLLASSFGVCLVCFHMWNVAAAAQGGGPPAPPVAVPLAANDAMPAEAKAAMLQKLDRLPLAFERRGESTFVARAEGYEINVEAERATIVRGGAPPVSMTFVGGRAARAVPGRELPGKVNYLLGGDPNKWRIGMPTYDGVTYREVYPGIDVVYYGNRHRLEFDLDVTPGADLDAVRLRFEGLGETRVHITRSGNLALGDLELLAPIVRQDEHELPSRYVLLDNGDITFQVDGYDPTRKLTIDPTIVAAGRFGGTGFNQAYAVALDAAGNIHVAGQTGAGAFPLASPAFAGLQGDMDGFIAKFDPTASTRIYSTYVGGGNFDTLWGLAVDSASGAAWVVGQSSSADFPLLNPLQPVFTGSSAGVVLKLGPGGGLLYSTYLTGSASAFAAAYGVGTDSVGNAYVAGSASAGFTTTPGVHQRVHQGSTDAFVTKLAPGGSLIWSTLIGGAGQDFARCIAVDAFGNAYVAGQSMSATLPNLPPNGAQTLNRGGGDAFVAKINFDASRLTYFTFLGGSGFELALGIAVDRTSGVAYVGGETDSPDFPATPGALQTTHGGGRDGFAAKLDATGAQFLYTTYLGGHRADNVLGVTVDPAGALYVAGWSQSPAFPTTAAVQPVIPGNTTSLLATSNTGGNWAAFDAALPDIASDVSPHPQTPGNLVAAGMFGIYTSVNGGGTWLRRAAVGGATLARGAAPSTIYALLSTTIYQSTDAGASWGARGNLPACCGAEIIGDPIDVATAYVIGGTSAAIPAVEKTTNGGATWVPAIGGLPANAFVTAIATGGDGSLYAGLSGGTFPGGVYKSTNRGTTWTSASTGLPLNMSTPPRGLAVARTNPSIVYVTDYFTLYRSTDAGATWTTIGPLPGGTNALAVSTSDPNTLYFSAYYSTSSLWVSTNGGFSWTPGPGAGIATPHRVIPDPSIAGRAYAIASASVVPIVAKIDAAGQSLHYSTYLGDFGAATSVATSGGGDIVAAGATWELPTTAAAALQGNRDPFQNNLDAFVARISDATAPCSYRVEPRDTLERWFSHLIRYVVTAPSGCAWTASSNQPWATIIKGAAGVGSGVVHVFADNRAQTTEDATLTIAGQNITLRQRTVACGYNTFSPTTAVVPSGGGTVQFDVLVGAGCEWTIDNSDPAAIAIASGATGTGNGTVTLTVAPNRGRVTRTFSIQSPQGGILTITQAGTVDATVIATITSTPSGAAIGVTGAGCIQGSYTTPINLTWNANTNCTLSFQTPQAIGGTTYAFTGATVNGGINTVANPLTLNSGSSSPSVHANFAAPCTYSLSPTSQAFDAQGGSSALTVSTASTCSWSAGTDQPAWVRLDGFGCSGDVCVGRSRTGGSVIKFGVLPNPSPVARTAFIFAADRTFRIDQQGFACVYSVSPTRLTATSGGGSQTVVVRAPGGCNWGVVSQASWIASGPSGSGNGPALFSVAPNSGPARTGTVLIAGQTVTVTQTGVAAGPATCGGATDVTSKVAFDQLPFESLGPYGWMGRRIRVINTSSTRLVGPLYLVFKGLPTARVSVSGHSSLTTCFSPEGDTISLLAVVLDPGTPGTGYVPYAFNRSGFNDPINYTLRVLSGNPPIR